MIVASLGSGRYIGGLPGQYKEVRGRVWATDEGVGIGMAFPTDMLVPLTDIKCVTIATVAEAKSKVPATLAFGVIGALTARGSEEKVALTVTLHSDDVAYFRLDVLGLPFAQSMVQPWLREHALDETSATASTGGADLISQLERLTQLHSSGALTVAEFTAAKAKLLNGN